MTNPQEILRFWFGDFDAEGRVAEEFESRWWKKDPAFDREIAERFGGALERAARGDLDGWAESPRGRLALILVLDQFSRDLFRGSPRAFAQDEKARRLCQEGRDLEHDRALRLLERVFFYMPLEHSEDPEDQERSVQAFESLREEAPEARRPEFERYLDFARKHKAIIDRFRRYPHRNQALGRPSTPEEVEFLKEPGSSF